MKPTMTSRLPAATSASRIRSQASRVVASGFSQNTCLPAAMDGEHVLLVGGSPRGDDDGVDLGVVDQLLPGLQTPWPTASPAATAFARSRSTSVTAVTRAPETTVADASDVVLPDHAHADDADVEGHGKSSQLWKRISTASVGRGPARRSACSRLRVPGSAGARAARRGRGPARSPCRCHGPASRARRAAAGSPARRTAARTSRPAAPPRRATASPLGRARGPPGRPA